MPTVPTPFNGSVNYADGVHAANVKVNVWNEESGSDRKLTSTEGLSDADGIFEVVYNFNWQTDTHMYFKFTFTLNDTETNENWPFPAPPFTHFNLNASSPGAGGDQPPPGNSLPGDGSLVDVDVDWKGTQETNPIVHVLVVVGSDNTVYAHGSEAMGDD